MRSLIIAIAATLTGCSSESPFQMATQSCADERQFAYLEGAANRQPIELVSFKTDAPTGIKLKAEKPRPRRTRDRAGHFVRRTRPALTTAKKEPSANRMPPPPQSNMQSEPKTGIAAAGLGREENTVGLAPNSNSRTIQEQVAAATAVAERKTVAALAAQRQGRSPNNTEAMIAIVMARSEIRSVSELGGKDIAMDEEYSASRVDIWIAFVLAGVPSAQLRAGHTPALDRLLNGEVPAAVVALASAGSAEGFPDIAGFKVFRVPLLPR